MHLNVCTPSALLSPPRGHSAFGDCPVATIPGRPRLAPPAGAGAPGASPPGLRWAGLGGGRRTHSLHPPSLVLEFQAEAQPREWKGPRRGTKARGALLCCSLGAPYICMSSPGFLLGEFQTCWSFGPCKKPVRAEVGRGVGSHQGGMWVGPSW